MNAEKSYFLKSSFVPLLKQIPAVTKPLWGKMTLQQMIEHFSDSVRIASGENIHQTIVTPEDKLPAMQSFLMSNKPFKENTRNPLMPEVPAPVKNESIKKAIEELEAEIAHFFSVFDANEHLTTRHPLFGDLNFEMNVQLLYKHAVHHLKQFGVNVPVALEQE
jgi:hypothetical protein